MKMLPRASPNLTGHVSVAKGNKASSLWISWNACTEIELRRCVTSQWDCVEVNNLDFIPGYKQARYYENEATWFLKIFVHLKLLKACMYMFERELTHTNIKLNVLVSLLITLIVGTKQMFDISSVYMPGRHSCFIVLWKEHKQWQKHRRMSDGNDKNIALANILVKIISNVHFTF